LKNSKISLENEKKLNLRKNKMESVNYQMFLIDRKYLEEEY